MTDEQIVAELAEKHGFTRLEPYESEGEVIVHTAINERFEAAIREALVRVRSREWIPVSEMPKKRFKDGEFGKEYLIHPPQNGETTAFYGTRCSTQPHFYKHGAVFHGVTHWQPLPPSPVERSK